MSPGERVIDYIADAKLLSIEDDGADGHIVVWSANAIEQLDALLADKEAVV